MSNFLVARSWLFLDMLHKGDMVVPGTKRKLPNARICGRCWFESRHRRRGADQALVYEYITQRFRVGRGAVVDPVHVLLTMTQARIDCCYISIC